MHWWSFSRPPSTAGTELGSFAAGGAARDVLDDHALIRRVAISLSAWPVRIRFGAHREFTANCSSSDSSSQSAQCRVTCENCRTDRHRPGAHLLRITLASSNATPKCCHRTCRVMTSPPRLPVRVARFRPIGRVNFAADVFENCENRLVPVTAGGASARSSTSEFHAPHSVQRPIHLGACAPHS